MNSIALITGATGQDGYYLAEHLISNGYRVHAHSRIPRLADNPSGIVWHSGDLADETYVSDLFEQVRPDELYNLAAVSSPSLSWQEPGMTDQINAILPHRLCRLILRSKPSCRLFQASTSDMFGQGHLEPQHEGTCLRPRTPYSVSKAFAHHMVGSYRAQYGLHGSCGILFNHDSPRRELNFVSQKIAHAAAVIGLGMTESEERDERGRLLVQDSKVRLGNIDSQRDFSFAGDIVRAIHAINSHSVAGDYVIGSGAVHSIREFCATAFEHVGLRYTDHIEIDPLLFRPLDTTYSHADSTKLRDTLGWKPQVGFKDLVHMMVDARLEQIQERI